MYVFVGKMFWKGAKRTLSTIKERYTGKEWSHVQDFQDTVLEKMHHVWPNQLTSIFADDEAIPNDLLYLW